MKKKKKETSKHEIIRNEKGQGLLTADNVDELLVRE
jgi:hypothetical protein